MTLTPQACSLRSLEVNEPLVGTAVHARFWVALEQPGAWGAKAFTQSELDPAVGRALERASEDAGGRALLIRRVGTHQAHTSGPRTVLVSTGSDAGQARLLTTQVDDPAAVLDLPFADLAAGVDLPGYREAAPTLLVCTNAKRDVCCAVSGRELAQALVANHPDAVWECSHLAGHRFAPTGVLLPTGQVLGRLTPAVATAALAAATAGRLDPETITLDQHRGLSHLPGPAQVVDARLRAREHVTELVPWTLRTELDGDRATVTVAETGEQFLLTSTLGRQPRPASCGKPDEGWRVWTIA